MAIKKKTISQLKKVADNVFSQYIRQKYADPHTGFCNCVTCGVQKHWKELQNGHYETRGVNALRYDERNAHPQCYGCNVARKGNYPRYAIFMVNKYGPDILNTLQEEAKELKQFKPYLLEEIIEEYKAKIAGLTA